jgi:deoxyribodipyrimidine photolyase-related protein
MSDYCKNCEYNPKEKYGEDACPFNYLYRNFIQKNTETIKKARQSFILKHLEKIDIEAISKQAEEFINTHILDPKSSVESDK